MINPENKQCPQIVSSTKRVQWSNNKLEQDENNHSTNFVTLRKSRKGTHLNDPAEFGKTPVEQSTIQRLVVLPTGGCCDMEYVLANRNQSKKQLSKKKSITTIPPQYPPSITINIGPSMPFHLNPTLPSYDTMTRRDSILSTHPKMLTEEQWETTERIMPSYQEHVRPHVMAPCCGVVSKEQRTIDLDPSQNNLHEEHLTYTTKTAPLPKISPFKSCWNCLKCKKKGRKDEIYMPSIINKNDRNVIVYPTFSRGTSFDSRLLQPELSRMNVVPSRLSTIAESEVSSQNISQESVQKK